MEIVRPKGQFRDQEGKVVFGPTRKLDYELEVAAFVGNDSKMGESVGIEEADEYIFGVVLVNDWSGEFYPFSAFRGKPSRWTKLSPNSA